MVILILASQELSSYERNINKNKTSHKPPNCTDKKVMINPMSFFFFFLYIQNGVTQSWYTMFHIQYKIR